MSSLSPRVIGIGAAVIGVAAIALVSAQLSPLLRSAASQFRPTPGSTIEEYVSTECHDLVDNDNDGKIDDLDLTCRRYQNQFEDDAKATLKPKITQLTASPTSIVDGGHTTISWAAINVASCELQWFGAWGGKEEVPPSSISVHSPPEDTTYKLTCRGYNKALQDNETVTVRVKPSQSNRLTATLKSDNVNVSESELKKNDPLTFTWRVARGRATRCSSDGGWYVNEINPKTDKDFSVKVLLPHSTRKYTLTCHGENNQRDEATIEIKVVPNIISFERDPRKRDDPDGSQRVSWKVSGAKKCEGIGPFNWKGDKDRNEGTDLITKIDRDAILTLRCSNDAGDADERLNVYKQQLGGGF